MTKQMIKDTFGWGFIIWLFGYILGILLFAFVPHAMIGWVIMPFGILLTLWVLTKKVTSTIFRYYVYVAILWTLIAILCDYVLLVNVFKPADGYYTLDVYLYYTLTFAMPLLVGWKKTTVK